MMWARLILTVLLLLLASPAWADVQAAVDAYEKGDYATALEEWRPLAEEGNAIAQFYLGSLYYQGRGIPQNYDEAARWFRKAAEQGHTDAQTVLGTMYDSGAGVRQDYKHAFRWYRRAAGKGDGHAQENLGDLYFHGHGVPEDYDQAVHWYRKAAEQGRASTQAKLGIMYLEGHGVGAGDFVLAYMWLTLAKAQGHEKAEELTGILSRLSQYMTPAQLAEAQRLAREWTPKTSPAEYEELR